MLCLPLLNFFEVPASVIFIRNPCSCYSQNHLKQIRLNSPLPPYPPPYPPFHWHYIFPPSLEQHFPFQTQGRHYRGDGILSPLRPTIPPEGDIPDISPLNKSYMDMANARRYSPKTIFSREITSSPSLTKSCIISVRVIHCIGYHAEKPKWILAGHLRG